MNLVIPPPVRPKRYHVLLFNIIGASFGLLINEALLSRPKRAQLTYAMATRQLGFRGELKLWIPCVPMLTNVTKLLRSSYSNYKDGSGKIIILI